MRLLLVPALLIAASGYNQEAVKWRADYESRLKAPDGWLSVVGLYWLHEGINKPEHVSGGVFRLHNGVVSWEPSLPSSGVRRTLKPDDPGPPDVVRIGSVSVTVIRRGGKLGVRVRDSNAPARLHFTG